MRHDRVDHQSVICTRAGVAGEFAVVQLANDQFAVAINGQCLEVFTWHTGQFTECMDFMMRLSTCSMNFAPPPRLPPTRPLPLKGPAAA